MFRTGQCCCHRCPSPAAPSQAERWSRRPSMEVKSDPWQAGKSSQAPLTRSQSTPLVMVCLRRSPRARGARWASPTPSSQALQATAPVGGKGVIHYQGCLVELNPHLPLCPAGAYSPLDPHQLPSYLPWGSPLTLHVCAHTTCVHAHTCTLGVSSLRPRVLAPPGLRIPQAALGGSQAARHRAEQAGRASGLHSFLRSARHL